MTGGGQADPYAELGVSRDASNEEIRRAYRRGRILVPVGTGGGDQLVLHDRGELIVLYVRVHGKDLTVLD